MGGGWSKSFGQIAKNPKHIRAEIKILQMIFT